MANLPGPTGRCPKAALARILDLVDWEGAAVLAATQIFHLLEFPIRDEYHNVIPRVVKRGHRTLDELNTLRWVGPHVPMAL